MNLPVEVIDHIFSFLQSDPASLRACSKAHPSLSQLAEPHLYSYILLKAGGDSSDQGFWPSNLAKLLSKRPHIARYIRSLEIQVFTNPDFDGVVRLHLKEISNILPMLLALRQIALDHSSTLLSFQWETQPESFRLAFLACLRLPSMQDVSLTFVAQFPFTSLLNDECKLLRELTLQSCTWRTSHTNVVTDGSSHPPRRLPFESLCFGDHDGEADREFIDWAATCLLQLRSLKFYSDEYDSLPKLLASCSTTLVNLSLGFHVGRECMFLLTFHELFTLSIPMLQILITSITTHQPSTSHLYSPHFHISGS